MTNRHLAETLYSDFTRIILINMDYAVAMCVCLYSKRPLSVKIFKQFGVNNKVKVRNAALVIQKSANSKIVM